MSYQIEKRKHAPQALPIQPLIPLTGARELLAIRQDIEAGKMHTGKNFELVLFSFNEIQKHFGRQGKKKTGCRSGCTSQMNQVLRNWFKVFDQHGGILPADKAERQKVNESIIVVKHGKMVPLDQRRAELNEKSYSELKMLLGEEKTKALSDNGKMAKKKDIIEELLKI